uniref:Methyltransferase type 11 domain-containing protein n=1 Tax=Oryza glumipatula TaxID=40148 RepID=A0A0D9ZMY6_9ORYZ
MAVDFSSQQLQTAASRQDQRWKPCYKNIKWIEGDALDLPFTDCYFDAVTVGYGLRNVVDKPKAMREIFRVLKPGSRASILDFNKSSSLFTTSLQSWMIDNVVVPLASGYGLTEEYKYLKSSILHYLTGKELEELAKEAGFSAAKHYELGGGLMGDLERFDQNQTIEMKSGTVHTSDLATFELSDWKSASSINDPGRYN